MNATYHLSKPRPSTRVRSLGSIASFFCSVVFLAACGGGGDELDGPVWVTEGQVVDANGTPVSGATVAVELDRLYSTSTDSSGRFTLRTPRNYNYPEYFAGYAQKGGYLPGQIFFLYQGGNLASSVSGRSVSTPIASSQDVILSNGINVVHLGDDNFGGSVNSQFQKRSQGIVWEDHFTLTVVASSICTSFYAKGVQTGDGTTRRENVASISRDGQPGTFQTSDLIDSPSDGSYAKQTHCFNLQGFQTGDRIRVAINSGRNSSNNDYDDFEFLGVTAKLTLPASDGAGPAPGVGISPTPDSSNGGLIGSGRLYDVGAAWQGSVYEYFIPQDQTVAAESIGPDLIGRCLAVATAWKRAGNSMLPAEDLVLKFFGSGGQSVTTPACLRAPNWPALEESVRNRAAACAAVPSLGMIVWTQTNAETIGGFDRRADNGQTGPEDWSSVINQMVQNRATDESDCLAAGGR